MSPLPELARTLTFPLGGGAFLVTRVPGGFEVAPIDGGPAFCIAQPVWDAWLREETRAMLKALLDGPRA